MALVTHKFDASKNEVHRETNYLLKDHLSSIIYILSASGEVVEEMNFDPWGQ